MSKTQGQNQGKCQTCAGKFVGRPTAGHQPFTPVDRFPFADRLRLRIEEVVQHLVKVLRTGSVRAIRVDVGRGGAFTFCH